MTLTGYDAAYCPAKPPATDVVLFYAPHGDQLNAWTLAEINAQPARYRLPIFVRSNPAQALATTDAMNMHEWLLSIGCPSGSSIVLDLETAVDATYVNTFGWLMYEAGYRTLPYGSSSTLFRNPALDGYFVAEPGAKSIPANCVAVQYGGTSSVDYDLIADSVPLWDTRPPPPPAPAPTPVPLKEKPVLIINNGTTQYLLFESGTKLAIDTPADLTALATAVPSVPELSAAFVETIPNAVNG